MFSLPNKFQTTALVSALILLLSGCEQASSQGENGHGMAPATVSVLSMKKETVPFVLELPARLSGVQEVEIRARVSGILTSRNFSEGDKVMAGTSLFSIDSKPYRIELDRTKAELDAANARLQQAQLTVNRLKPLSKQNSVSKQQYDDALSTQNIMLAELDAAKARYQQAQLNVEYSQVKAPISGIVSREQVSEGTYISGPQDLLTHITRYDPIRVRFGLSQRQQLEMSKDVAAGLLTLPKDGHWQTRIKLADGSFYQQLGTVNFSDVRINSSTGTSEFQADIANSDLQLRPGQFVRVLLEGARREQTYVVPQQAVLDNGTGKFVYVMVKGEHGTIAKPAPVEVGEWVRNEHDGVVENNWIIRNGLHDGDQVIVDGMARIFFPGMPVQVASNDGGQLAAAQPAAQH